MERTSNRSTAAPLRHVALYVALCLVLASMIDGALYLYHRATNAPSTPTLAPYATPGGTLSQLPPETQVTLQPGFNFRASTFHLQQWALSVDQYGEYPLVLDPTTPRDPTGAKLYTKDGQTYWHPVVLAEDGLEAIHAYAATNAPADLSFAEADAHALIANRTTYAGGWWYPYQFDFDLHGDSGDIMHAPWYSAMSQGEALNLFDHLYEITRDAQWRTAADATFATFLHPYQGDNSVPWVVNVDQDGYVWLQEYPGPAPDYTINGMNFATVGIISYYLDFHDTRAQTLADGTLLTMLHALPYVNHPGWMLGYCLTHETLSAHYHGIVTQQMTLLYNITGDPRFAAWALTLIDEYPIPEVQGSLHLPAGTYTLLQADVFEQMTGSSHMMLASSASYGVSMRLRLAGQPGFWYRLADGPYAGSFIQESATVLLAGQYNTTRFLPAVTVTFPPGSYTSYTLQGAALQPAATTTVSAPMSLSTDLHATIDGTTAWHITSGQYVGRWLAGPDPQIPEGQ